MFYILWIVFLLGAFIILYKILEVFKDGFDWFSATLYAIIFLTSCGLLYVMLFGIYYAIVDGL
ncbi:MAG: hypothetical protein ACPGVF_01975 [Flavobacteriaceae bacterium]